MYQTVSVLGCGWLGLPLAGYFIRQGCIVKGSTTSIDKQTVLSQNKIIPYLIDFNKGILETVLHDFLQTDVLIVTIPPRSRTQLPGVYLEQMKRLTLLILQHPGIKQLVYTSSTSVYPDHPGVVKESDVIDADQAAQVELVQVEQLFLSLPIVRTTIVRLGGLTGGSRLLARHFAGKKELPEGKYPVNLIHLEDAVGVIGFVIAKGLAGTFNACSPIHPGKKKFYSALASRFQLPLPEFNEDDVKEGKIIDTQKLEEQGYCFLYRDPQSYTYTFD